jgi:hypothetical protein
MTLDEFRESQEKGFSQCLIHQSPITGNVYVLIDDTSLTKGDLVVEVKRYIKDKDGRWTVGFLYAGNDYVCAMNAFQKCLNEPVDGNEELKFICPNCKGHRLECCQDGYHVSEVLRIDEDGDHDYAEIQSHGDVTRWQCQGCGYVLEFSGDIIDNLEVTQWVKENCNENG